MNERTARQTFLGEDSDYIFSTSPIAILGLCGGGSHIAQQLAHIGFENLIIVDFDIVEEPNLNRMIGSCPQDVIDRSVKIDVIENLIKHINPKAKVTKLSGKWQEHSDVLRICTAITGCLDSFIARDELERFCRRCLIPYIDVGMDVHKSDTGFYISGQVITSLPESLCMRCLGYITEERLAKENNDYGNTGGNPQVIWPNGVLASIAVGQLVKLLTPWNSELTLSPMIDYDGNKQHTMDSPKLAVLEKHTCIHYKNNELGDPFYSANTNSQGI